jgi:hypothetical protein
MQKQLSFRVQPGDIPAGRLRMTADRMDSRGSRATNQSLRGAEQNTSLLNSSRQTGDNRPRSMRVPKRR